ncbi:MAG: ABC-type transport auxiliary lipoprotein family protein [Fibrobacterota bacterium]
MQRLIILTASLIFLTACGGTVKQEFYIINYIPDSLDEREMSDPYPFVVRVRSFDIEKIYKTHNIVYRKSPYQLEYYGFRLWAIHPADMMTDLLTGHLAEIGLVRDIIRRFDEIDRMADYEISGRIEAIEEYDSDDVWFAHLKYRIRVQRLRDKQYIYTRTFDLRKKVGENTPAEVVKTLSEITDITYTRLMKDLDRLFAKEYDARGEMSDAE